MAEKNEVPTGVDKGTAKADQSRPTEDSTREHLTPEEREWVRNAFQEALSFKQSLKELLEKIQIRQRKI